jgi:hypothetical protein
MTGHIRNGLIALTAVGMLAACREPSGPVRQEREPSVSLDVGAATLTCAISKPMPSPVQTWTYFGPNMSGATCGVSWSFSVPAFSVPGIWTGFVFRSFVIVPGGTPPGAPIYTFATSYNNGEPQGGYSLGPMEIAFAQPVDRFVMEFLFQGCSVVTCGSGFRRLVVQNDSGRTLLDTLAVALAIIDRPNIRRVLVYPDSVGMAVGQPIPTVVGGWYTISFRPDSSCPPSGDSILDSKQVRDAFRTEMAQSLANGPLERGGEIWKMLDGSYQPVPRADPFATECSYGVGIGAPPLGAANSRPSGVYHTHPSLPQAPVTNCPGQTGGYYDPDANGGGSAADWDYASNGANLIPVYAYGKSGRTYRLDPLVPKSSRSNNKNRWRPNGPGCFTRF